MQPCEQFSRAIESLPLIPVLRGITPEEAVSVVDRLYQAGFRIAEVTLNSPDPFKSISRIAANFGDRMLIGAGTVTSPDEVDQVKAAGGRLVISPHFDSQIVKRTIEQNMVSLPGVMTPSEAIAAYRLHVHGLKIFPCEVVPPNAVAAMRSVLPKNVRVFAVGGINSGNMLEYLRSGATGFGIGSSLYKPERTLDELGAAATDLVQAFKQTRLDLGE